MGWNIERRRLGSTLAFATRIVTTRTSDTHPLKLVVMRQKGIRTAEDSYMRDTLFRDQISTLPESKIGSKTGTLPYFKYVEERNCFVVRVERHRKQPSVPSAWVTTSFIAGSCRTILGVINLPDCDDFSYCCFEDSRRHCTHQKDKI
jgi:hypothetical protein